MIEYKMEEFEPSGKEYVLEFDKYECCKKKNKFCPIEQYIKYMNCIEETYDEAEAGYCMAIANNLINNGFLHNKGIITIYKYSCGHYQIGDGRHRICICAKLGMKIPVLIRQYEDSLCKACLLRQHRLNLKYLFRKRIPQASKRNIYVEKINICNEYVEIQVKNHKL